MQYWYKTVDLFDKSRSACKFARQRFSDAKNVGMITQSTMENYKWRNTYGGIYIHWWLGYLKEGDQIEFLKNAKDRLDRNTRAKNKKDIMESYIFLLDNVAPEGAPEIIIKKQRWRTQKY